MSTIASGTPTSGYENLSALLEFVKSPDYLDRIKELRDLEDRSRRAHDEATAAVAEATTQTTMLADEISKHQAAVSQFQAERDAHNTRVSIIQTAIDALQKALRG